MTDDDSSKLTYDGEWQRAHREVTTKVEKYPGILGEPVYIDPSRWPQDLVRGEKVQPLATKAQLAYRDKINQLTQAKWELLFWFYGIDGNKIGPAAAWEELARALVGQHVPGFGVTNVPPAPVSPPKPKKRSGRPAKYTIKDHYNRVMQVKTEEAEIARRHPGWPDKRLTRRAVENLVGRVPELWPESKDGKSNLDSAVQLFYDSWQAMIDYAVKHGELYKPAESLAALGRSQPTVEDDLKDILQSMRRLFKMKNDLRPSEFRHELKKIEGLTRRYIESVKSAIREGRRQVKENGHKHPEEKVRKAVAYFDETDQRLRDFEETLGKIDQEFS